MGSQQWPSKLSRGFTLVELLISTSILLLMMVLAMFSYQLFQQNLNRNLSAIQTSYQSYRLNELLSESLQSVIPYLVRKQEQYGFYFLGDEQGFTAVTDSAVFSAGQMAVFRLFAEKQSDGMFRLVYEEALIHDAQLVDATQNLSFLHRVIVKSDQKRVQFSYFVQPSIENGIQIEEETGEARIKLDWLSQHDGLKSRTHPKIIKINLSGFEWQVQVPSREHVLKNRLNAELEVN